MIWLNIFLEKNYKQKSYNVIISREAFYNFNQL